MFLVQRLDRQSRNRKGRRLRVSLDLHDLRTKITAQAHAWLDAQHRVSGEEISAIVRGIVELHVEKQIEVARVADALMRREGLPGIIGVKKV